MAQACSMQLRRGQQASIDGDGAGYLRLCVVWTVALAEEAEEMFGGGDVWAGHMYLMLLCNRAGPFLVYQSLMFLL